jgi:DNA-binding response OmpR family regulator
MSPDRILVVDDEPHYVRALCANLRLSGYEVIAASDGAAALRLARSQRPDLILLDIRMPDMTGYQVCAQVRAFSDVPIIMLTALAETKDKVRGLDQGADGYVTKPFSAEEVLARVRAALRRRSQPEPSREPVTCGLLTVDPERQRVFFGGIEVDLTPTEHRLLCELASAMGQVLPTARLLEAVWGPEYAGDRHLVWQAIHRLRQKIETDPARPRYILARPGRGYLLAEAPEEA